MRRSGGVGVLLAVALAGLSANAQPQRKVGVDEALVSRGEASLSPTRVYSRGFATYIWPRPRKLGTKLGYVRVGQSVAIRPGALVEGKPVRGAGCARGFYPVEPRGWVCLDRSSTLDPYERYAAAMSRTSRPSRAALPFQYALSNGAPMYRRLPSPAEWAKVERFLGAPGTFKPLSWGNKGHERLAEKRAVAATIVVPSFFSQGGAAGAARPLRLVRRTIPLGSMLAYTASFDHAGRTFLLSADGTAVPADRVRPFRESVFAGRKLSGAKDLPLAWVRGRPARRFVQTEGAFVPEEGTWPVRHFLALQPGVSGGAKGKRFLKTKEQSATGAALWVSSKSVTVEEVAAAPLGVSPTDRWVQVSLTRGTLVAYEGSRPVYFTLVSPGVGGVPMRGRDPVKQSATPLGLFRVTYKHHAATMSPEQGENRSFWIADVPYTQYFHAPFALHVAYWHENFGELMSAGCVNLSPRDGRWLFGWTGPSLPEAWNGVRAGKVNGAGTWVFIRR